MTDDAGGGGWWGNTGTGMMEPIGSVVVGTGGGGGRSLRAGELTRGEAKAVDEATHDVTAVAARRPCATGIGGALRGGGNGGQRWRK